MWLDERNPDPRRPEQGRLNKHQRWHAVAITPGNIVCPAARACQGKRFLSTEAPRLPLEECAARCECKYHHYADRRGTPRRAEERGWAPVARVHLERRSARGRRTTD